jgi:hypothetical protein
MMLMSKIVSSKWSMLLLWLILNGILGLVN